MQQGKGKVHQHGWAKGKVHCQVTKPVFKNSEYALQQEPQCSLEKLVTPNSENLQPPISISAKYSFTKQDWRALCIFIKHRENIVWRSYLSPKVAELMDSNVFLYQWTKPCLLHEVGIYYLNMYFTIFPAFALVLHINDLYFCRPSLLQDYLQLENETAL